MKSKIAFVGGEYTLFYKKTLIRNLYCDSLMAKKLSSTQAMDVKKLEIFSFIFLSVWHTSQKMSTI